jgi:hypothetical protein
LQSRRGSIKKRTEFDRTKVGGGQGLFAAWPDWRGHMTKATTLTEEEKRVVKALIAEGMRNQDIHALINYERPVTVNFGRITGIKKNDKIAPASPEKDEQGLLHLSYHSRRLHL